MSVFFFRVLSIKSSAFVAVTATSRYVHESFTWIRSSWSIFQYLYWPFPSLDDSHRIGGRALDSVASSSSACVRRVCSALLSCRSHFLTRSSQLTHSSLSDEQTPQHTWCKSALTLTSPIPSPDPRHTTTSSLRSLRHHNLISIDSAVQNFYSIFRALTAWSHGIPLIEDP